MPASPPLPASLRVVAHERLTRAETAALRALFDAEYRSGFGAWDPDQPYGYAPADLHVLATDGVGVGDALLGHVGLQLRTVAVGGTEVLVAGTGGVLVAPVARGSGLGRRVLRHAQTAMRDAGADFGYLGCREEVVPFYASCGWRRVSARERSISRLDGVTVVETTADPLLVCAARRPAAQWPAGAIDLRGRPW